MVTIKFDYLLHLIWPNKCVSCHCIIKPLQLFCDECLKNIKFLDFKVCKVCLNKKQFCDCHKNPRWYKRSFAPFINIDTIQNSLVYLKKQKNKQLISYLASKMAEVFEINNKNIEFDCIIPVPMHKQNYKKRGYNQSQLIAQSLSEIINIPVDNQVIIQIKKAKTQHSLDYKSRKENVRGIYYAKETDYNNVLLVDDIITTGFTINECAKTLKLSGVNEVYVLAAARNFPQSPKK